MQNILYVFSLFIQGVQSARRTCKALPVNEAEYWGSECYGLKQFEWELLNMVGNCVTPLLTDV